MRELMPLIQGRRKVIALSLVCFFVYSASYIGRMNYSAALSQMIDAGAVTRTQGGCISTIYFLCYGAGQLVNGIIADRHHPVHQVTVGVVCSALMNCLMPLVTRPAWMYFVWGANGYFQSLIWAPTFLVITQSVPPIWRNRSLLLLNSASSAGMIGAYIFSSMLLKSGKWMHVFQFAAIYMVLAAILWTAGCAYSYRNSQKQIVEIPEYPKKSHEKQLAFWKAFLFSGGLILTIPTMIHGMLKDGITNWLPTYLTENFSVSAQQAVTISILLPVINLLGAVMEYTLMLRFRQELVCGMILFGVAGGSLLILQMPFPLTPIVTTCCLALVTATMMGINVIFCSEVPIRFAAFGRAAAVSGFYNAFGYIGTAISIYTIAQTSQQFGWRITQTIWLFCDLVAAALCCAMIPLWNRFLHSKERKSMIRKHFFKH